MSFREDLRQAAEDFKQSEKQAPGCYPAQSYTTTRDYSYATVENVLESHECPSPTGIEEEKALQFAWDKFEEIAKGRCARGTKTCGENSDCVHNISNRSAKRLPNRRKFAPNPTDTSGQGQLVCYLVIEVSGTISCACERSE